MPERDKPRFRPSHRPTGRPSAPDTRPSDGPQAADRGADAPPAPPSDGLAIDRYERLRESLDGRPGGEALPAPMLDGFLCGVLLQPRPVPLSRWWPAAADPEGEGAVPPPARPGPPVSAAAEALEGMRRMAIDRHAALEAAIAQRQWFDPWVLDTPAEGPMDGRELDGMNDPDPDEGDGMPDAVREAVYPWVAGFAHAMACFQDLLELADPAAAEPQALLCQFLDREDLEDAEALFDLIDTLEPPAELGDAVEMLVRATLLLADISRPRPEARNAASAGPGRGGPNRSGGLPPRGGRPSGGGGSGSGGPGRGRR